MKHFPRVILVLIGINVVFFLPYLLARDINETLLDNFALYFFKNDAFHVWQFVTYMFLHGNELHIFFNMFALASFGIPLSMIWGWKRFLIFYFATGIGAGIIYSGVNYFQFSNAYEVMTTAGFSTEAIANFITTTRADPALIAKVPQETLQLIFDINRSSAVGASGAIYGVLVAFGFLFPNAKLSLIFLPVPIAAKYFIPAIVSIDLFSGITGVSLFGGGIAHFAHVGGAAIGLIITLYWKLSQKEPSVDVV